MERDTQRSRVYRAEQKAFPDLLTHDREQFGDLEAVRRYVAKVCRSKRIQARYPRAAIIAKDPKLRLELRPGGGSRRAAGGWREWSNRGTMRLPLRTRNEQMILHELAHILAAGVQAWHDWRFAECYLYLTLIARGRVQHDALKASFKAQRVRFTKPRPRRQLTAEQRAACIERLERNRARVGVLA